MLKIRFIVVDRTRSPFLKEGETFYLNRLKKFVTIEWIAVRPARLKKGRSEDEILRTEARAITRKLGARDYVVALDRRGQQYDSMALAQWLNRLSTRVNGWTCFIIGGPLGLSKKILERSNLVLSLSQLTLTHEMCRLFIIEQTYRALTILEGHRYHK